MSVLFYLTIGGRSTSCARVTYRGYRFHEGLYGIQHPTDVSSFFDETVALGKRHCAHDIEGKELTPITQVKDLAGCRKS